MGGKDHVDAQQGLTHKINAAMMPPLFNADVQENQIARKVIGLQLLVTLAATGAAYSWEGTLQYAIPVLAGGGVSVLNGALLVWRMTRASLRPTHGAHQQLKLMYFYAAERFVAVIALLGICLVVFKFSPLAVLSGFVLGQSALLAGWLLFKTKD
ncbi:MAG: ATP synthase subunit I [Sideroxydans sp.]|nr:ATP synthase subunit I [Sideroxydans sp.]